MSTLKQEITQTLKIIILAGILSLGLGFVQAWTGPTVAPTGGNTEAPINIGTVTQIKLGDFWAGSLATEGGGYFGGNVGIGTVSPTQALEVMGGIKFGDTTTDLAGTKTFMLWFNYTANAQTTRPFLSVYSGINDRFYFDDSGLDEGLRIYTGAGAICDITTGLWSINVWNHLVIIDKGLGHEYPRK